MSEVITPVTVIGDSAVGGTAVVDSGDIAVVAGNLQAVDIVSNNINSVITDATNISSINTVAASNTQILNVNSNLSAIQTVNSNLTEINRYYTTFLGASATDPTVRLNGTALQVGDMYYSTTLPGMKVRAATAWEASNGTLLGASYPTRLTFTATAGQTLFTVSGGYTANQLDVFQNGTKLVNAVDVDVSSGTTFTLTVPATAGDTLEVVGLTAADTISGSLRFQSGTAAAPSIAAIGDTNTGIFFPAADTIAFAEGGAEAMRINSSGSVGIGTTAPGTALEIGTTASTGNYVKVVGSNADDTYEVFRGERKYPKFTLKDTFAGGSEFSFWNLGNEMRFGTNNATTGNAAFVVSSGDAGNSKFNGNLTVNGTGNTTIAGNVGIGTVSPINKLHLYTGTVSVGATQLELEGRFNGYGAGINFSSRTSGGGTLVAMAKITADGEAAWNTTGTTQDAGLRFSTTQDGTLTERLRIDSSGKVGIGTTAPASLLHIENTTGEVARFVGNATANMRIAIGNVAGHGYIESKQNNTNTAFPLSLNPSGGNVGIGTTSPSQLLEVGAESISNTYIQVSAANNTASGIKFRSDSSLTIGYDIGYEGNGNYFFFKNAVAGTVTERMRIDSAGNVGIGTTSPAAKLHASTSGASSIDETIRLDNSSNTPSNGNKITWRNAGQTPECGFISGFREGATTGFGVGIGTSPNFSTGGTDAIERIRINSSGNVGIGSTAPVNKLEVVGSFGRGAPVTKTADFTLAATENWIIVNKATTACTVTLPAASSWTGREFTIKTLQALAVVSASSNVVLRNGTAAGTAILTGAVGNWATLVSDGTNWVIMCGS